MRQWAALVRVLRWLVDGGWCCGGVKRHCVGWPCWDWSWCRGVGSPRRGLMSGLVRGDSSMRVGGHQRAPGSSQKDKWCGSWVFHRLLLCRALPRCTACTAMSRQLLPNTPSCGACLHAPGACCPPAPVCHAQGAPPVAHTAVLAGLVDSCMVSSHILSHCSQQWAVLVRPAFICVSPKLHV